MENRILWASAVISTTLLFTPSLTFASFDHNLGFGDHGQDVVSLQQFLIAQGLLAAGNATGYFGRFTVSAVRHFQSQQDIAPATGFFGPLTRPKVNAIVAAETKPVNVGNSGNSPFPEFTAKSFSDYKFGYVRFEADDVRSSSEYTVDLGDGSTEPMVLSCRLLHDEASRTPCYVGQLFANHTYGPGSYTARLVYDGSVLAKLTVVVTQDQVYIAKVITHPLRVGRVADSRFG
jgi:Putative peptidoglycan binding domain